MLPDARQIQEHRTRQTSAQLFEALSRRDAIGLRHVYLRDATYVDPVVGEVPRGAAVETWLSFLDHVEDLELTVRSCQISVHVAVVRWHIRYRLTATKRRVALDITTHLICLGPRISRHEDVYDSWLWARMAHGIPGMLLGWSATWRRRQAHPARSTSVTHRNTTT